MYPILDQNLDQDDVSTPT